MKKTITIIKDWGTLVAFCVLIYTGMQIRDTVKENTEAIIKFQEFQKEQDKLNARESIVYNWALQKLYGTEIHGLNTDDDD